ncbi:hypothetical protein L195_g047461 [Trifolium pratense]|uniref:Uncharacterized protein n=1 Tax=Trifolium pratense TaxID=57577 RepID=A0A2K3MF21_TRIPR|nr:hypothetical protein L195_g045499 [Trifolium pratense]PNX91331.1 hypothetical protein L195_g047461 [Trifolium pratense]
MTTNFRLVHPRTSSHRDKTGSSHLNITECVGSWGAANWIIHIGLKTTIQNVPIKPAQVFSVFFVLTWTLYVNFLERHSSKECSKSNTLNCGDLMKFATKREDASC